MHLGRFVTGQQKNYICRNIFIACGVLKFAAASAVETDLGELFVSKPKRNTDFAPIFGKNETLTALFSR